LKLKAKDESSDKLIFTTNKRPPFALCEGDCGTIFFQWGIR